MHGRALIAVSLLCVAPWACAGDDTSESPDASILVGEGPLGQDTGTIDSRDAGGDEVGFDLGTPDVGRADLGFVDAGPPDSGDPCTEVPSVVLSALEAVTRSSELEGRLVRVTGLATTASIACTSNACADGTMCCNRCRAPVDVEQIRLVPSACAPTATIACVGTPCQPLSCTPPLVGFESSYDGVLRGSGDGTQLELIRSNP